MGVCITLTDNSVLLCIGRFIYGLPVGVFSVYTPKFLSETAPIEIKGSAGALNQVQISLGILIAFAMGLQIGELDEDAIDSFEVQYYWYVLFMMPMLFSLI